MSLLVILQPLPWSCWCHRSLLLRNENPDALPSHNCTKDHSIVVIGAAFSLIVITLQTKSFVRVHCLVVSNILIKKIEMWAHDNFILISWREKVDLIDICFGKMNKLHAFLKQNFIAFQMCVLTLLHMRHCCPVSGTCLQNFKISVSL